jgi:iron-sulfur cluster repair protein YtfE (RIC family)
MKRQAALAPWSREHQEALVLARRAVLTHAGAEGHAALVEQLLARWDAQLAAHLAAEERRLLPALAAAGAAGPVQRVRQEHASLRSLTARLRAGDSTALSPWGDAMREHVRYEEREVFPLAERVLDLERLAADLMA